MILRLTPGSLTHEFACHSKVCAPPPAGHGGSDVSTRRTAKRPPVWSPEWAKFNDSRWAAKLSTKGKAAGTMRETSTVRRKPTTATGYTVGRGGTIGQTRLAARTGKIITSAMPQAYKTMASRQKRQDALAQTNRARANYGMKPIG